MAIPFTCPFCGAFTEVDDAFAGQSGPCQRCGQQVTVPMLGAGRATGAGVGGAAVILVLVVVVIAALLVVGGGAFLLMSPVVTINNRNAARSQCEGNLRQLALAMHNYHDTYGVLPPAYLADANGTPQHSWRVLLLPFLEQGHVYNLYDFSRPWDDAVNLQLASRMPPVYGCPHDTDSLPYGETSYMVIVGRSTMFPGDQSLSFRDVTDGTANTVMIVEVHRSGVSWLEPRDLTFDQLTYALNGGDKTDPASPHVSGVHMALGDGSVRFVPNETAAEILRAMYTRNGGEVVSPP